MLDIIAQGIITCTGCLSLYLMASQSPRTRMWAAIIGLTGEPFWLTTAYLHEQWGIVALAVVYGVNWVRCAVLNWRAAFTPPEFCDRAVPRPGAGDGA